MGVYGRFERHDRLSVVECGPDMCRDFEELVEARIGAGGGSVPADQWPRAGEQRWSHGCGLVVCRAGETRVGQNYGRHVTRT